ncbi:hypothetical protein QQ045_023130 [Rhodiola kirilowii]
MLKNVDFSGLESYSIQAGAISELASGIAAHDKSSELPSSTNFDGFLKEAVQMVKPAKGTTTLAFIFKEGVMVAADSRASMGGYICMHLLNKLYH